MLDEAQRLIRERVEHGPGWTKEYLQNELEKNNKISRETTETALDLMVANGALVRSQMPDQPGDGGEVVTGRIIFCLPDHH